MKIAIASDHRGFTLKEIIIRYLASMGHSVNDLGPDNEQDSVDYPDYGQKVGKEVAEGRSDKGILICGTGIGMSLAANKVNGVRAALCHDLFTTEMSRRHNDANVLCLGTDIVNHEIIDNQIQLWLETEFENGRHARRVNKIKDLEAL